MSNDLVLTVVGAAAIEAAYNAGEVVTIAAVQVGDGGGAPVTADPATEALAGMFGSEPFSAGGNDDYMISGTAVIPAKSYPGRVIRELGLMSSEGVLIAYGSYPDTYLPAQNDSIVKQVIIDFMMPLVHAECVTLEVDPNIAVITQETGDKRYLQQALRLQEIADQGEEAQAQACDNIYAVSKSTTVNDHPLSGNINVTPQDIFKLTTGIGDAADLNTFTAPGLYYQHANEQAGAGKNYPEPNAGSLEVYKHAGITQVYRIYNNSRSYIRTLYSGEWSAWTKQYDAANKPSASDTGALPITGGTLTGDLTVQDTIQVGGTGSGVLNIGDSDSGLRSSKDGQVDLWANSKVMGYWNTTIFSFTGQIIPTNYENFDKRYYTQSAANAKFVTQLRLGAYKDVSNGSGNLGEEQNGYVATMGGDFGSDNGYYRLRPVQFLINATWGTAAFATSLRAEYQSYPAYDFDIFTGPDDAAPLRIIERLSPYRNTRTGHIFSHLIDAAGHDWYQVQKQLEGAVFIAFNPESGVIELLDHDVSALWPEGLSVAGLDDLPDECRPDGSWFFDGAVVHQDTDIVNSRIYNDNLTRSNALIAQAVSEIVMLQSCVETGRGRPDDEARIQTLRTYLADLRETDLTAAEPGWPALP
ncbi:phage tail-collar fiber domain-containing protein [Enterobacter kobei]